MVEARTGKVNDNDSEEHNDLLRIYYGLTPRVFFFLIRYGCYFIKFLKM